MLLYVTHAGLYEAEKHEETLGCKGSKNQKNVTIKGKKNKPKSSKKRQKTDSLQDLINM